MKKWPVLGFIASGVFGVALMGLLASAHLNPLVSLALALPIVIAAGFLVFVLANWRK